MRSRNCGPERVAAALDVAVAVLMAAAAVMTAWATYQGSQWDGVAADARSQSALLRSDAGRAAADAVTQTVVDSQLWTAWEEASLARNLDRAEMIRFRFSPELEGAHRAWLGGRPVDADGNPLTVPTGSALNLDSYLPAGQRKAEDLAVQAETALSRADTAGGVSGRYVLQAVLLAMVLFFASVAVKFRSLWIQASLTLLAVAMLAVVAVRMSGLPVV